MDDIELIKQRINIVDLISEYLPLKKAGVNFKAPCPFHQEKTPSFMVSPERGIWHCFGCDKGGDIFKFLMEKESIDFKDALETLAQKAGVILKHQDRSKNIKLKLFEINQKALQFYNYLLLSNPIGKKALEYLKSRGLKDQTIKDFNLGYAPLNWESLTKFLKKRGYTYEEMEAVGLCVPSKKGGYDRFRGRIMFPLINTKNEVIGFSGRILEEGEPKYINTPQTIIFDKGRFLFGLNLSKGAIKEKNQAIIVEGEMDMILSFQEGIKNIAASKGTALTENQIESLRKYTDTISLCFDTDLAGDAASRRGIEMADSQGFNIKVIEVKDAKDPAELCKNNPKLWEEAVNASVPIYDYYLQSISNRFDIKLASSKKAVLSELLPIWKKITDPMVKEHYIQKLSAYLQVKDDFIRKELNAPVKTVVSKNFDNVKKEIEKEDTKDRRRLLEEYLISLLLHLPEEHIYVPNFPETLFTQEELKQSYVLLVIFLDSISFIGKSFKISEYVKTLPEQLVPLVDRLYLSPIDEKLSDSRMWQKELENVISELKRMLIKASLEKLTLQIKNAQEFDKLESLEVLNRKFRDLSVKLKSS